MAKKQCVELIVSDCRISRKPQTPVIDAEFAEVSPLSFSSAAKITDFRFRTKIFLIVFILLLAMTSYQVNRVLYVRNSYEKLCDEVVYLQNDYKRMSQENSILLEQSKKSEKELKEAQSKIQSNNKQIKDSIKKINEINASIAREKSWDIPVVRAGVCSNNSYFKTYMDYRAITSRGSTQYRLLHDGTVEYGSDGLIRTHDGYIAVALGSYYGSLGSKYICTLSSGKQIKLFKIEAKANRDTRNGCTARNGDIIEFVIDTKKAKKSYPMAIRMGNFNYSDQFNGKVVKMEKVK